MPTIYTSDIRDGISFKTFALNCARAFGACVEIRDEPGGGEKIPEAFKASDYHLKKAIEDCNKLLVLNNMTPAEAEREALAAWQQAEKYRLAKLEEIKNLRASYEAMLVQVIAWAPPTADHAGLRDFMIKQIEISIECDCRTICSIAPRKRLTGSEWAAQQRDELLELIADSEREYANEVRKAAERTAWVQSLKMSLQEL
jgi:hypothetical protein